MDDLIKTAHNSMKHDFILYSKVDLDLGNYERFLDIKLTRDHNITTGKIYQASWFISIPVLNIYL